MLGTQRIQAQAIDRTIKIPMELLELDISNDARVVYGILLSLAGVSAANGWIDEDGYVYVQLSVDNVCKICGCSKPTGIKVVRKLIENRLIDCTQQNKEDLKNKVYRPRRIYPRELVTEWRKPQTLNDLLKTAEEARRKNKEEKKKKREEERREKEKKEKGE